MRSTWFRAAIVIPTLGSAALVSAALVSAAHAGPTISVATSASESAAFGSVNQSAGPFPWSDLGITASAGVSPGTLDVQTGGSTAFQLGTTFTSGEVLSSGDPLDLSYNPNWTGSSFHSAPAGNGAFNSNFVYNIGPFNGSTNILNVPLFVPGATTGHLASSLNNTIVSPPVSAAASVSGPGVSATATLAAQGCFIVCVTVASASLSFNVGTQIQQSIIATPLPVYGDWVWESTTPTYSAADHPVFVPGTAGSVTNAIEAPSGLSVGQTFYYNVLPGVELQMPIIDSADVAVPASITASWDIFGAGGSETWPLGNLYELGAVGAIDFDPTFYGSQFFSLPLIYDGSAVCTLACDLATFTVGGSGGGDPVSTPGGTVPGDTGPCGGADINCSTSVPSTGTPPGGYGNIPLGPLFPGDCGPIGTPYAGYCINTPPTSSVTPNVPEPDTLALSGGAALSLLLLSRRRRTRGGRAPSVS